MAQLFSPYADTAVRVALFALAASPAILIGGGYAITRSPYITGQFLFHTQPVLFSHEHHVGFDGLDCRYCHFGVETSRWAGIPPTEVCMTCHSQLFTDAPVLATERHSLVSGEPIRWTRVRSLPDYVYFDHAIHIAKGVGCTTCHGQVDQMPLTLQAEPMTMAWCINCHKNPAPYLRKPEDVFADSWSPPPDQHEEGRKLMAHYEIDTTHLIDCSVCHR
ncbi:MAG: cytochrome c3 family protein [Hyphomicrobiales bacterium]|nr:cytochrome c3 family protein [Hyphomicrobiales bacterium]